MNLVAVDIGTTHCRAIVFDSEGRTLAAGERGYSTQYDQPGMAVQDPEQVSRAADEALEQAVRLARAEGLAIGAVVLSSVWQSLMGVDGNDAPVTPLITWADSRSVDQVSWIEARVDGRRLREETGCPVHPIYFPTRIRWLRESDPATYRRIRRFISIKEYIVRRWVGEYAVDLSVASGTGLLDIGQLKWHQGVLDLLELDESALSPVVEPTEMFRDFRKPVRERVGLPPGTPLVIGAADGALAHLGTVGASVQGVSLTTGTGAAIRRLSHRPAMARTGETWCYYLGGRRWLHGGLVQDAGLAFEWFIKQVFADKVEEARRQGEPPLGFANDLLRQVPAGANGLTFLPFLMGERSPNLRPDLRAAVFGIGLNTTRDDMLRALAEGIGYRLKSVFDQLVTPEEEVHVVASGGFLKTPEWVQIVCDFLDRPIHLPWQREASAWGAALIALLALGQRDSLDDLGDLVRTESSYTPRPAEAELYRKALSRFAAHYEALCASEAS